jgi:hypothetical protein
MVVWVCILTIPTIFCDCCLDVFLEYFKQNFSWNIYIHYYYFSEYVHFKYFQVLNLFIFALKIGYNALKVFLHFFIH